MDKVITVPELALYLRVHTSTVYRHLKRGDIPAFKLGRDWRFNIESIDEWRLRQETSERAPVEPLHISGR
jgi:excisionase family DNA binding protein